MAMKLVDAEQLEADLTSVADKIRAKTGGEEKLAFPSGYESALDTIESADSALAEVEYLMSDGYTSYSRYFQGKKGLTEIPMKILQHISEGKDFSYMFLQAYGFEVCPVLDTSSGENFNGMFQNCESVVTILGIDISNAIYVTNLIASCPALKNITFIGVIKAAGLYLTIAGLTHESLMSAINALYDYASEGSTSTHTLTLGSTNLAKLTDAEKAIAISKGWTLQ